MRLQQRELLDIVSERIVPVSSPINPDVMDKDATLPREKDTASIDGFIRIILLRPRECDTRIG